MNKNNCYVKTKGIHFCKYCNSIIANGSRVKTINPKHGNRFWVCKECDSELQEIIRAVSERNSLAFGDDGGYLAISDYIAEVADNFLDRCTDEEMCNKVEKYIGNN